MKDRRSLGTLSPVFLPITPGGLALLRDSVNTIIESINLSLFGNIVYGNDAMTVLFAVSNTDTVVPHNLKRVPRGLVVLNVDKDGAVVRADSAKWTTATITLRCSVTATTAILVVV